MDILFECQDACRQLSCGRISCSKGVGAGCSNCTKYYECINNCIYQNQTMYGFYGITQEIPILY